MLHGQTLPTPADRRPVSACPVCRSARLFYQFSVEGFRVVRCNDCALMLTNPQPSDAELDAIYDENYFLAEEGISGRQHTEALKAATADEYLALLTRYGVAPGARLLEIGCGHGDFLVRAAHRGLDVTGVEYSASSCAVVRQKLGGMGEVIRGEIDTLSAAWEGQFDVVAASDVIEHVRDPQAFLAAAHRLLKPGGVLFLATPTLDSWSARLLRNSWMEFKPEHLWYFKSATLQTLLTRGGFGGIIEKPCRKTLDLDYIADHFERYPVPGFSPCVALLRRLLPTALRRRPLRVVASGMVLMSRRQEISAKPVLSIVVPAYNEAPTLDFALQKLLAKEVAGVDLEIVIVESNSDDGTRELVARYEHHPRVTVVWEDAPLGKGHAVRAGLERVTGDYVMIQDADLEYDLEDYEALLEPLLGGRAAFVLGARHGGVAWKMRQFTGQPVLSAVMNTAHRFFTFLVNALFGARLRDPFTMYKVFRRDCLHGLRFECDRFDFDFELVIKLLQKGYKPLEIPVNYRSRSFAEGKKVSFLRDPLTWLRALAKFRLSKVNPLEEVARQQRVAVPNRPGCPAAIS